jgi:hypothetical protein
MRAIRSITRVQRRTFAAVLRKLWELPKCVREQHPCWRALESTMWLIRTDAKPYDAEGMSFGKEVECVREL